MNKKIIDHGQEPESIVVEALKHINTGKILDIGSGTGRHALFLAEKGFDVHAIDVSEEGIKKLQEQAEKRGLDIKAEVADLTKIKLDDFYDMIICSYVNHHLSTNEAMFMVDEIKLHTNSGGLNVIAAFTKNSDLFGEDITTDRYFPETQELGSLYKDWKILEHREEESKAKVAHSDGSPMYNLAAFLIAQKQ
ncbi:MAG: methyltransferase domain-containing protein [Minisyncoccia bacterium]